MQSSHIMKRPQNLSMKNPSKIACIASFPPPLAGQSLAAEILFNGIMSDYADEFELKKLNLSEAIGGESLLHRSAKILHIALKLAVFSAHKSNSAIYLQLGHGKTSILRDTLFLAIGKAFGKKCIGHVHGSGYRLALEALPTILRKAARHFATRCDAAIVLSESLRSMFEDIVNDKQIFCVANGIEPALELAARQFTRNFDSENKTLHLLYLSNLLEAKGYDLLLEQARQSAKNGDKIHYDFVGPKIKGQTPDIEEYIQKHQLNNVTWHGSKTDKAKYEIYKKADIFCLPSQYEGQPLCILEAMHFALPIISTTVGGIPDIFQNKSGAILIPPKSPQQLNAAIQRLARNPALRQDLGRANKENAIAHYSAKAHVSAMVEVFRALLS